MNDNYEEIVKNVDSLVSIYMGFVGAYNEKMGNVDNDTIEDSKVMLTRDGNDKASSKISYKEDGTIILKASLNTLDDKKEITMTVNSDETVNINKWVSKLHNYEDIYNYCEIRGTEKTTITPIDGGFSIESDSELDEDVCVDGIWGERPASLLLFPGRIDFKTKDGKKDIYPLIVKTNISNLRRIFNSSSVKEMELKKSSNESKKEKRM